MFLGEVPKIGLDLNNSKAAFHILNLQLETSEVSCMSSLLVIAGLILCCVLSSPLALQKLNIGGTYERSSLDKFTAKKAKPDNKMLEITIARCLKALFFISKNLYLKAKKLKTNTPILAASCAVLDPDRTT